MDPQSNGASPVQVADQGFLYEERISRLVADKEKLKKEGDEMRLALEDLEERLEHSQAINVRQNRLPPEVEHNLILHDSPY